MRTCEPILVTDAAKLFDDKITNFFNRIFVTEAFVNGLSETKKIQFKSRLNLNVNRGGIGVTSIVETYKNAYLGSLGLTIKFICDLFPNLREYFLDVESNIRPIKAFRDILELMRTSHPTSFQDYTIEQMIQSQAPKLQALASRIQQERNAKELDRMIESDVENLGTRRVINNHHLDEEKVQHVANKDSVNSAFLTANPGDFLSRMSNPEFRMAIQARLLVSLKGDNTHCLCNEKIGILLAHCVRCPTNAIRCKLRNPLHRQMQRSFVNILKNTFTEQH